MEKLNFENMDESTHEYLSKTQDFDANLRFEFLKKITHQLESLETIEFHHLEEIKTHLALSGRQICLLLKMDPSAWSRWSKSESVPKHVYQALVWYVQLIFQSPQVHQPYELEKKIKSQARENDMRLSSLKKEIERLKNQTIDPKADVVGELGSKVQESFENILLKFRDQMMPQKTLEIESLKYENRKLQDKVVELQSQMQKIVSHLTKKQGSDKKPSVQQTKAQKSVEKKLKPSRSSQPKRLKSRKNIKRKLRGKKNVGSISKKRKVSRRVKRRR